MSLIHFSVFCWLGTSFPVYRNPHVVCKIGEELCGRLCHSPTKQQCLTYSDGSGPIVCDAGDTFCGGSCLSPSSGKVCVNFTHHGQYDAETICDPGNLVCGWRNCYAPESQVCLDNRIICPKGQTLCGRDCYSPSSDTHCLELGHWLGFVCKTGERICGGRGCYRPEEKFCFEGKGTLCDFGEEVCGSFSSGSCFKRGDGQVCLKNQLLCKTGEAACGNHCYDPTIQACHNDDTSLLCTKGQLSCGNYKCYNVSAGEQCFQQAGSMYHEVCAQGQEFCGSNCYEHSKEVCFETTGKEWGKLCPVGSQFCGKGYETTCFDPSNGEVCLDAGTQGEFVCANGESLCGKTCYKEGGNVSCLENKILCQSGDVLCGGEFCYNNLTSQCLKIK